MPDPEKNARHWLAHSRWPFRLILLIAAVLGFISVQHGTLFYPDELRVGMPLDVAAWFIHHDKSAMQLLATSADRPLYYVVYGPALFLQFMLNGWSVGIDPVSHWSLPYDHIEALTTFQILLFVLNTALFMRITGRWLKNRIGVLLAGVLFVLWLPNLFFTRHILPSFAAETFLLLAADQLLPVLLKACPDETAERKQLRRSGLFWIISFLVYPGFYYTMLAFLFLLAGSGHVKRRLSDFLRPVIGTLLLFWFVYDVFFQGHYLGSLLGLAASVYQGNTGDGLGFILQYYWMLSPLFLLLWLGTTALGLWRLHRGNREPLAVLATVSTVLYLWLAVYPVVSHTVLYGRVLLPMSILLLWQTTLLLLELLESPGFKQATGCLLLVGYLFALVAPLPQFWTMRFPLDLVTTFKQKTGYPYPPAFLHTERLPDYGVQMYRVGPRAARLETRSILTKNSDPGTLSCQVLAPVLKAGPPEIYVFLNNVYAYPVSDIDPLDPGYERGDVLLEAPHPFAISIYQYEGLSKRERQLFNEIPAPMLLVKNPCR